jgi:serine/threonine-protein kinase RsbW
VVHAGPHDPLAELQLTIGHSGQLVRVEVVDASTNLPTIDVGAVDRLTGRGLLLLDALSSDWGVDTGQSSKVVWFEVEV